MMTVAIEKTFYTTVQYELLFQLGDIDFKAKTRNRSDATNLTY